MTELLAVRSADAERILTMVDHWSSACHCCFAYDGAVPAPLSSAVRRRDWFVVVAAVIRRPDLWFTAVQQVLRLAPNDWWRTWPPLPVPADDYLRFRTATQYGDPDRVPTADDVISWLEWSRSWGAVAGAGGTSPARRPGNSPDQISVGG